jgi:hypothetical protein
MLTTSIEFGATAGGAPVLAATGAPAAQLALRRGHPRSGSSAAVASAAVISRRCARVAVQPSRIGRTDPN